MLITILLTSASPQDHVRGITFESSFSLQNHEKLLHRVLLLFIQKCALP